MISLKEVKAILLLGESLFLFSTLGVLYVVFITVLRRPDIYRSMHKPYMDTIHRNTRTVNKMGEL